MKIDIAYLYKKFMVWYDIYKKKNNIMHFNIHQKYNSYNTDSIINLKDIIGIKNTGMPYYNQFLNKNIIMELKSKIINISANKYYELVSNNSLRW